MFDWLKEFVGEFEIETPMDAFMLAVSFWPFVMLAFLLVFLKRFNIDISRVIGFFEV